MQCMEKTQEDESSIGKKFSIPISKFKMDKSE